MESNRETEAGVVKRREIGAAATAPRSVLRQRSINSSSNLSRKSHSSAYAAANTDSETEGDMDTWLRNRDHASLHISSLFIAYPSIEHGYETAFALTILACINI